VNIPRIFLLSFILPRSVGWDANKFLAAALLIPMNVLVWIAQRKEGFQASHPIELIKLEENIT
jgi:hypothetical protein